MSAAVFAGKLCNVAKAAAYALVLLPIGQMPEALIIPSIHAQERPNWNERYDLIVRLDGIAKEKESSLPVGFSTRVFGSKVHRGSNESLYGH